jgi:AcrR family transcriptional regulator
MCRLVERIGRLRMESVAARAGVAKSTLYRHWPDKLALIEGAERNPRVREFHHRYGAERR